MPKGELKNLKPFSKDVFDKARIEKGYSLRKLCQETNLNLRTLCRSMTSGKIKRVNFDIIAQYLNIQPSLLSGTYPPLQNGSISLDEIDLSDFPYEPEHPSNQHVEYFVDLLLRVLSLFDVSTDEINNMATEKKYEMLKEMVSAIDKIANDYFPTKSKRVFEDEHIKYNYTGTDMMFEALENDEIAEYANETLLTELEKHKKSLYNQEYADSTLRQELLKKKPKGYTKKQIAKMDAEKIVKLDELSAKHYCSKCGSCISDQPNFSLLSREWKCAICGAQIKVR